RLTGKEQWGKCQQKQKKADHGSTTSMVQPGGFLQFGRNGWRSKWICSDRQVGLAEIHIRAQRMNIAVSEPLLESLDVLFRQDAALGLQFLDTGCYRAVESGLPLLVARSTLKRADHAADIAIEQRLLGLVGLILYAPNRFHYALTLA